MKSLDGALEDVENRLERVGCDLVPLLGDIRRLKEEERKILGVQEILLGLRDTQENFGREGYEPGKSGIAYFYVKEITDDDVVPKTDFEPGLTRACSSCKQSIPVLMSYSQICDSPTGDEWEKRVFSLCPDCLRVGEIRKYYRDGGFFQTSKFD